MGEGQIWVGGTNHGCDTEAYDISIIDTWRSGDKLRFRVRLGPEKEHVFLAKEEVEFGFVGQLCDGK